jgi:SOS response regulatory protein OraA/RecX
MACRATARQIKLQKHLSSRRTANAQEKARQMRFLQGRGFSLEIILALLQGTDY